MKILFFASLRERLGVPSHELTLPENSTVEQLLSTLKSEYGSSFFPDNIICAVNQTVANSHDPLKDSDEIAFYPPVTGG